MTAAFSLAQLMGMAGAMSPAQRWLWQDRYEFGSLGLLTGDPKTPHELVATDIIARASAGLPMPCEAEASSPRHVLIHAPAEHIQRRLLARLAAAAANFSNIRFIDADERPAALEAIKAELKAYPCSLVVLFNPSWPGEDEGPSAAMRKLCKALADILATYGPAGLMVLENARVGGGSVNRAQTTIAKQPAILSASSTINEQGKPGRYILRAQKSDFPEPPDLVFTTERDPQHRAARVLWLGKASTHRGAEREEAKAWMAAMFAAGAEPTQKAAKEAGFTRSTYFRAKQELREEQGTTTAGESHENRCETASETPETRGSPRKKPPESQVSRTYSSSYEVKEEAAR